MDDLTRRDTLKLIATAGASAAAACVEPTASTLEKKMSPAAAEQPNPIVSVEPLGFPWKTPDPFLFCVHHDDHYPKGNAHLGPAASLAGRQIGQDFDGKDGWNMYHGHDVPGFPEHPHRGFETVTVVRNGLLDHSDSMGATARYGGGDVQWLTAGRGIQHAEMFPLTSEEKPNPVELFQIWMNLPKRNKLVEPHFSMLWSDSIPTHEAKDADGRTTQVTIVAGRIGDLKAPPPPPKSWASQEGSDVAIWTIKLAPGARWTLPAAVPGSNRMLYFFKGKGLRIAGRAIEPAQAITMRAGLEALLEGGPEEIEILMLQGRPISEPVVQYGPFVMNTREEIRQTIAEYQQTQFGGWPWASVDPVHPREEGRFARRPDGSVERPA